MHNAFHNQPLNIANLFNGYFINILTKLDKLIIAPSISPLQYMGRRCENIFFALPSPNSEILLIINLLKNQPDSLNTIPT